MGVLSRLLPGGGAAARMPSQGFPNFIHTHFPETPPSDTHGHSGVSETPHVTPMASPVSVRSPHI